MADRIGQDDEILRRIQRAARFEQAGELRHKELRASAAGAVAHHHGIDDLALGVANRRAGGAVMLLQRRQGLAVGKAEILCDEVGFGNGRRGSGSGGDISKMAAAAAEAVGDGGSVISKTAAVN